MGRMAAEGGVPASLAVKALILLGSWTHAGPVTVASAVIGASDFTSSGSLGIVSSGSSDSGAGLQERQDGVRLGAAHQHRHVSCLGNFEGAERRHRPFHLG